MSLGALTAPAALEVGDELANHSGVTVTEVHTDAWGTWVEYSDGDAGYQDRPVRILPRNYTA